MYVKVNIDISIHLCVLNFLILEMKNKIINHKKKSAVNDVEVFTNQMAAEKS